MAGNYGGYKRPYGEEEVDDTHHKRSKFQPSMNPPSPDGAAPPPPTGMPTSTAPAGGWVWRPDLPNPTSGGYGTWVWQPQQQPTMPAYTMYPPPYYSAQQMYPPPPFPGMVSSQPYGYQQQQQPPSQHVHPGVEQSLAPPPMPQMPMQMHQPPPSQAPQVSLPISDPDRPQQQRRQNQNRDRASRGSVSNRQPYGGGGGGGGNRDPFQVAAIAINKRMTSATRFQDILDIVARDSDKFDTVCLATAVHKLASIRGAPNLHQQIATAPEFHKLKQLIMERHSELQTRNISNILWALAKMNHHPGDDFLSAMADEIINKARQGNAQNTANMIWAFATLNYYPGEDTMRALEWALKDKLPEFTSQNISNSVLSFAKLEYTPQKSTLDALAEESRRKIRTFTPQALSNTLWGLSKLGMIGNEDFLKIIASEAIRNVHEFNSQNLANAVWAFATIGVTPSEDFLKIFARESIRKMNEFSPQNISNILWAYAKLGYPCPDLYHAADKQAVSTMANFLPQAVSNALWAHATADMEPSAAFYSKALSHARQSITQFTPQNLANTTWSIATMRNLPAVKDSPDTPEMIDLIAREVTERLQDSRRADAFTRQHLANVVWSWAAIGHDPGKKFLIIMADALVTRAEECNAQEIANSVWAFATLHVYHGPLFDSMCGEACHRLDAFNEQNMTNLLSSLAKITHFHEVLLIRIADSAVSSIEEFSNFHFVRLLWGFAFFNFSTPNLMPKLTAEFARRCDALQGERFTLHHLALLGWSLAVLDAFNPKLWDMYQLQLIQAYHEHVNSSVEEQQELGEDISRPSSAINQIFQSWLLVSATHPDQQWVLAPILLEKGQQSWSTQAKEVQVSGFHSEVSHLLTSMGIAHSIEHFTEDKLFSIDIALPEEMVAIEVDGPSHFAKNNMRPLANLFIRKKLLEARGWKVASVPFYDWTDTTEDAKKVLLRNVLKDVRSQKPGAHPTVAAAAVDAGRDIDRTLARATEDDRVPSSGEKENTTTGAPSDPRIKRSTAEIPTPEEAGRGTRARGEWSSTTNTN